MNTDSLIDRVIAAGGDAAGIQDRFAGNSAMYAWCFQEFLDISNHQALDQALAAQDLAAAFAAAHGLKGLSANLGLTPYYTALSALVESLRSQDQAALAGEYAAVQREFQKLQALTDATPPPEPPAPPPQRRPGWLRILPAACLLGVAALVLLLAYLLASYGPEIPPPLRQGLIGSALAALALFAAFAILNTLYLRQEGERQKEAAVQAREQLFDLLVRQSRTAFGLFRVNQDSPLYLSGNAQDIAGESQPYLVHNENGWQLRGQQPPSAAFDRLNESLRAWDGHSPFRSGFLLNEAAAPPNYFEIQLLPLTAEGREYVGIAQDVTLLQEREAATRKALALAEQASAAKSRFLSNMSHDIRTPMNAIVNMADFAIEDMADPERLREHLATIRESSDHLLLLINDILDMSRIESGQAVIELAPFDLSGELKRLQSITQPLCDAKEQMLFTDFSSLQTPAVLGDQVKVSQILMNLLSNAVKFTPKHGAVRFIASELPTQREGQALIRFTVEDTGIGIAPEFLPYIFAPFTREDKKRVTGIQGTGLGLSICHSYVLAMGGSIRCESEVGEGSLFTVELSFEKTDALPQPKSEASAWDVKPFIGLRCLLCEDNSTNQRIAKTVLERLGFRVDTANDGKEGLRRFERTPAPYFDVIFMDIQMPVMDGYEAAAAIRLSSHSQAQTIPIIAMTANVFMEDVEKAHIAGMDGHVGKPITAVAVANETNKVLHKRSLRR